MKKPNASTKLVFVFAVVLQASSFSAAAASNYPSEMFEAIRAHDLPRARRLLDGGLDVNWADSQKNTLLHFAAGGGAAEIAALLIERGADPEATNLSGGTPAHRAAASGSLPAIEAILGPNADLEIEDGRGRTLLHSAAWGGQVELTRVLLARGADVAARDSYGLTAFHHAAFRGRVELLRLLLDAGADPHPRSERKETALHRAALAGRVDAIVFLADLGLDLDARDTEGKTALGYTLGPRHHDAARILLERGADPNLTDREGKSSFYHAIYSDNDRMVGIFLPYVSLGAVDRFGNSALHFAASEEDAAAHIDLLIGRGAEIDRQNVAGQTPLHRAFMLRRGPAVRRLLAHGADPDIRDQDGIRALNLPVYAVLVEPMSFSLGWHRDAETQQAPAGSLVRIDDRQRYLRWVHPTRRGYFESRDFSMEDLEILAGDRLRTAAAALLDGIDFLGIAGLYQPGSVSFLAELTADGRLEPASLLESLLVDTICGADRRVFVYPEADAPFEAGLAALEDDCEVLGSGGLSVTSAAAEPGPAPAAESPLVFSTRPIEQSESQRTPDASELLADPLHSLIRAIDLDSDGTRELLVRVVGNETVHLHVYRYRNGAWVGGPLTSLE